jgi:hypothetical protein
MQRTWLGCHNEARSSTGPLYRSHDVTFNNNSHIAVKMETQTRHVWICQPNKEPNKSRAMPAGRHSHSIVSSHTAGKTITWLYTEITPTAFVFIQSMHFKPCSYTDQIWSPQTVHIFKTELLIFTYISFEIKMISTTQWRSICLAQAFELVCRNLC